MYTYITMFLTVLNYHTYRSTQIIKDIGQLQNEKQDCVCVQNKEDLAFKNSEGNRMRDWLLYLQFLFLVGSYLASLVL